MFSKQSPETDSSTSHLFRHEKWFSDYEASPLDENERKDLEDKRRHRKECTCRSGREDSPRTPKYRYDNQLLHVSYQFKMITDHIEVARKIV